MLGHGQRLVEGGGLQDDADALSPRPSCLGGILAENGHGAAVTLPVALQDLDGRGLPRAVRAEEPEDLAGGDLEADAAERFHVPVGLAQI